MRSVKEYALYKGETLLEMGTVAEIADRTGVTVKSVYHYQTPAYARRASGDNARRLVLLDGEEDTDEI